MDKGKSPTIKDKLELKRKEREKKRKLSKKRTTDFQKKLKEY
ncbi:hypothetical protein V7068_11010 [Bacillus sp. JJ634]